MPNSAIQKFIEEVKRANQPFITTDTQIVCGRVVLTALPGIESQSMDSYRLEFPTDYDFRECPYPILFIMSVFDAATFLRIQPHIGAAMRSNREYSERINNFLFRTFQVSDSWVVLVEAVPASH
jgi:hypothetical protein